MGDVGVVGLGRVVCVGGWVGGGYMMWRLVGDWSGGRGWVCAVVEWRGDMWLLRYSVYGLWCTVCVWEL